MTANTPQRPNAVPSVGYQRRLDSSGRACRPRVVRFTSEIKSLGSHQRCSPRRLAIPIPFISQPATVGAPLPLSRPPRFPFVPFLASPLLRPAVLRTKNIFRRQRASRGTTALRFLLITRRFSLIFSIYGQHTVTRRISVFRPRCFVLFSQHLRTSSAWLGHDWTRQANVQQPAGET